VAAAKSLLHRESKELCLSCHGKEMMAKKYKQFPAAESCASCHLPHSGAEPKLLSSKMKELCLQCHEKVEKTHLHGMGKSPYVDAKTGRLIDCVSCNNPHSSEHEKLSPRPTGAAHSAPAATRRASMSFSRKRLPEHIALALALALAC